MLSCKYLRLLHASYELASVTFFNTVERRLTEPRSTKRPINRTFGQRPKYAFEAVETQIHWYEEQEKSSPIEVLLLVVRRIRDLAANKQRSNFVQKRSEALYYITFKKYIDYK